MAAACTVVAYAEPEACSNQVAWLARNCGLRRAIRPGPGLSCLTYRHNAHKPCAVGRADTNECDTLLNRVITLLHSSNLLRPALGKDGKASGREASF